MNIEHLEYILEIYKSKSINNAAKKLFISQPRLSLVLKGVEEDLGYPIFMRSNRGIQPTELGSEFIKVAERIYQEYQNLKLLDARHTNSGNLSVSSCYCSLFSHIFFTFKRSHPATAHKQDIFNESPYFPDNIKALSSQRNRMAVTYFASKDKANYEHYAQRHGMTLQPLPCRLPLKAVLPAGHPLAGQEKVSYRDLLQYPIVTYFDVEYDVILGTAGFSHEMDIQYVSCRATYYDALRLGDCISISIDFAPGEAERLGCVCRTIEDADYAIPAIILPHNCLLNEREKAFLDFFTAYVTEFAANQKTPQTNPQKPHAKKELKL